jgi:hypothetical protein
MSSSDLLYRIADEPRINKLSRMTISPFYIVLASMVVDFGLGVVWLLFNSFAMGSSYARRDLVVALAAVAGIAGTAVISVIVLEQEQLQADVLGSYLRLAFKTAWIALCYYLYLSQMKVYPLFQYYRQRNAELRIGN